MNGPANAILIAMCEDHEHVMVPESITPERLEDVAARFVAEVAILNAKRSGFPVDVATEEIAARIVRRAGDHVAKATR